MCAGISPEEARLARVKNTIKLRRMWVSEALLEEAEKSGPVRVLEGPRPMRFDEHDALI
jgi:hypothetical protein